MPGRLNLLLWIGLGASIAGATLSLAGCGKSDPASSSSPAAPPSLQVQSGAGNDEAPPHEEEQSPAAATPTAADPATSPSSSTSSSTQSTQQPAAQQAGQQQKATDVTPGTTAKPAVPDPSSESAITPPPSPTTASFLGLTAPKPATWIWHPPAHPDFTAAEYVVPGRDGVDQARVTVFHKIRGSLDSQIARWKTMFRDEQGNDVDPTAVEEFQTNNFTISLVEFRGEYQGPGSPSFKPDHIFITAMIHTEPTPIFIRLVGPAATVQANREAFMAMLHNLQHAEAVK